MQQSFYVTDFRHQVTSQGKKTVQEKFIFIHQTLGSIGTYKYRSLSITCEKFSNYNRNNKLNFGKLNTNKENIIINYHIKEILN